MAINDLKERHWRPSRKIKLRAELVLRAEIKLRADLRLRAELFIWSLVVGVIAVDGGADDVEWAVGGLDPIQGDAIDLAVAAVELDELVRPPHNAEGPAVGPVEGALCRVDALVHMGALVEALDGLAADLAGGGMPGGGDKHLLGDGGLELLDKVLRGAVAVGLGEEGAGD